MSNKCLVDFNPRMHGEGTQEHAHTCTNRQTHLCRQSEGVPHLQNSHKTGLVWLYEELLPPCFFFFVCFFVCDYGKLESCTSLFLHNMTNTQGHTPAHAFNSRSPLFFSSSFLIFSPLLFVPSASHFHVPGSILPSPLL